MKKIIMTTVILAATSFSQLSQAALIDVASIEFSVTALKKTPTLSLTEVILLEQNTGSDLALSDAGATVGISESIQKKKDKRVNSPAYVIDGLTSKKQSYRFIKGKKTALPTLTINLAEASTIASLNAFGKLQKSDRGYISVNFLDSNGNSIYEIANLNDALGGNNTPFILPDLGASAGSTVSSVPLPASAWLFGSGLLGVLGLARRKS